MASLKATCVFSDSSDGGRSDSATLAILENKILFSVTFFPVYRSKIVVIAKIIGGAPSIPNISHVDPFLEHRFTYLIEFHNFGSESLISPEVLANSNFFNGLLSQRINRHFAYTPSLRQIRIPMNSTISQAVATQALFKTAMRLPATID